MFLNYHLLNANLITRSGPNRLTTNEHHLAQPDNFLQVPGLTCGNPESLFRVLGGSEAYEGEYPWMVKLQPCACADKNCTEVGECFTCGGVIISPNHILTAAHCVDFESDNGLGFWKKAPSYIFQKTSDTSEDLLNESNVLFFDEIHIHPDWVGSVNENIGSKLQLGKDLAVVRFSTADGSSNIENMNQNSAWPVCLPMSDLCLGGGGFALANSENPIEFSQILDNFNRVNDQEKKAMAAFRKVHGMKAGGKEKAQKLRGGKEKAQKLRGGRRTPIALPEDDSEEGGFIQGHSSDGHSHEHSDGHIHEHDEGHGKLDAGILRQINYPQQALEHDKFMKRVTPTKTPYKAWNSDDYENHETDKSMFEYEYEDYLASESSENSKITVQTETEKSDYDLFSFDDNYKEPEVHPRNKRDIERAIKSLPNLKFKSVSNSSSRRQKRDHLMNVDYVWATGWGFDHNGQLSTKLREAQLPVVAKSLCQTTYSFLQDVDSVVCAGFDEKQGSCTRNF